jgi:hypothetical protein
MTNPLRACCALTLALALAGLLPPHTAQGQEAEASEPSLSLRTTPAFGFTPLRVRVVATLQDGSDDYEDYYCASVEWDWDDGTISESSIDCDPYEAGSSEIQRRFTAEHIFREQGRHRVTFRLKQKGDVVAFATTNVQVRIGVEDRFGR